MAVRNFYVEADIDGRATTLGGGPRRTDGTMSVNIYQRNEGSIDTAFVVKCRIVSRDGKDILITEIIRDGKVVSSYETER